MFSDEIKQVVYIAVSMIILAMVLGMVMVATGIQKNFSSIRNEEIASAQQTAAYREFGVYNNQEITSEEVIAFISKYYDSGIDIYFKDGAKTMRINKDTILTNPNYTSIKWLQGDSGVGSGRVYKSILVYDYDDVTKVTGYTNMDVGYYDDVTGIAIIR